MHQILWIELCATSCLPLDTLAVNNCESISSLLCEVVNWFPKPPKTWLVSHYFCIIVHPKNFQLWLEDIRCCCCWQLIHIAPATIVGSCDAPIDRPTPPPACLTQVVYLFKFIECSDCIWTSWLFSKLCALSFQSVIGIEAAHAEGQTSTDWLGRHSIEAEGLSFDNIMKCGVPIK